jgi:hypothetical protein
MFILAYANSIVAKTASECLHGSAKRDDVLLKAQPLIRYTS